VRARTTKDTKVHEGKPEFLCVPSCPLWLTLFPGHTRGNRHAARGHCAMARTTGPETVRFGRLARRVGKKNYDAITISAREKLGQPFRQGKDGLV